MHEYPLSQIRCLAMKPVHKTNIIVSRCQILLWYQCGLVFYAIYVHICSDTYMSFFLKSYSSHAPAMQNFFFFSFFFFLPPQYLEWLRFLLVRFKPWCLLLEMFRPLMQDQGSNYILNSKVNFCAWWMPVSSGWKI